MKKNQINSIFRYEFTTCGFHPPYMQQKISSCLLLDSVGYEGLDLCKRTAAQSVFWGRGAWKLSPVEIPTMAVRGS